MINQFPKEKFRVHVVRFHREGDGIRMITKTGRMGLWDDDREMLGAHFTDEKYAVCARLYEVNSKVPLLTTWSRCNKSDQPNRKEGVKIAMERLVKAAKGMEII